MKCEPWSGLWMSESVSETMKFAVSALLFLLAILQPPGTETGNIPCSAPDDINNGQKVFTGTGYLDTVTYTCNTGYELTSGTETRTCSYNGAWNGMLPTCTAVESNVSFDPCSVPDDINNGLKNSTGINHGDTVTYTCRAGYVLSNDTEIRTCNNGTWNGTLPTCNDIDTYFSFACDVNGTITAQNPDPTSLIWTEASNEDGPCTTAFTAGNVSVTISGCPLDKTISLVFSPFSDGIPTLILDNVKFYNVTCNSIPLDGINVMVTDNTWVRNLVSTSVEPVRTPSIIINSALNVETSLTNETSNVTTTPSTGTTEAPSISINQKLKWRLMVPETYIIQPINCTAFSGEIDELGSKYSLKIIEFGCSLDISLVTDFMIEDEEKRDVAYANLFTFRFPESNEVEIACSVKGCPSGSNKCDYSCGDRKRRSLSYMTTLDDYTDLQPEVDRSRERRYDEQSSMKIARIKLIVHGPPNVGLEYLMSCGPPLLSHWTVSLLVIVVAVVTKSHL